MSMSLPSYERMLLKKDGHQSDFLVPRALPAERTHLAPRRAPLAHFLSVAAQQHVRALRELRVPQLGVRGGDRGSVRGRIIFRLLAVSEAEQDAQGIRVGGERHLLAVEQQDAIGVRLTDARELAQGLLGY